MLQECRTGLADLRQPSAIHYRRGLSGTRAYAEKMGAQLSFGWRDTGYAGRRRNKRGSEAAASRPAPQGSRPDPGTAGRAAGRGAHHGGALGTWRDTAAAVAAAQAGPGAGGFGGPLESLLAAAGQRQGPTAAPRQVPAAVADFTGRAAELQALTAMLDQAGAGAPGTVVISAIGGTAGVGKTALALHWAHQVAGRFRDGQLYVNLRGFDPSGTPGTAPEAVIRGFLDALGVPPERFPASPEAQAGLYRSLLADRRDADRAGQRPRRAAGPAAAAGQRRAAWCWSPAAASWPGWPPPTAPGCISLDVLSHAEAVQLLAARLGAARAAAEPAAVDRDRPLVRVPAAGAGGRRRPRRRPPRRSAGCAGRRAAPMPPAAWTPWMPAIPRLSVRAVFSWSTRQLSRRGRADVPAAGHPPRPRHHRPRRRQPRRHS